MNLTTLGASRKCNRTCPFVSGLFYSALMSLSFIRAVACVRIPSPFKAEQYSTVCLGHVSFMQSPVRGHWGYFHLLAAGNNAVRSLDVEISVQAPAFGCLGDIPRVTADSYGNPMLSCLRNRQKCSPQRAHHPTSPPALHSVPIPPPSHQHLASSFKK